MSFRYDWILVLLLIQVLYWIFLAYENSKYRRPLPKASAQVYDFLTKKVNFDSIKIKHRLILAGLFFLTIAASGPQVGKRIRPIERKGVDLVIVLDTSKSMDANDVTPSRLAKAKFELNKLIRNLSGDRVSIIVFAGSSHLYLPLTSDYEAALLFLNEIETDMIPNQGTSLSTALNTAINSFTEEIEKFKVVLLVTDGEDHEGEAIEVAKKAAQAGMRINTIAVGSDKGGLIPVGSNNQYKRDKSGKLVTSKVDQIMLKDIAIAGGGLFYWFANNRDSHLDIEDGIESMEKKTISTHEFSEYEDRYQIFGMLSFALILISFVFPTKGKFNL